MTAKVRCRNAWLAKLSAAARNGAMLLGSAFSRARLSATIRKLSAGVSLAKKTISSAPPGKKGSQVRPWSSERTVEPAKKAAYTASPSMEMSKQALRMVVPGLRSKPALVGSKMNSLGIWCQESPPSWEKLNPVPAWFTPCPAMTESTKVATHTVSPTASRALIAPRPRPLSSVKVTQSVASRPLLCAGSSRATPLSVPTHR